MTKDFDVWNIMKKNINDKIGPFCHERELWWCTYGLNIGYEQDGSDAEYRRPALTLKSLGKQTCCVIPLTTSKSIHKYRVPIGDVGSKQASALLSQMRVIDTKMLIK